jgi:putative two-component system response regulator
VLQLINGLDSMRNVITFSREIEELILSLTSQAAIAVKNAQLTASLKKAYLDSIYHLSVAAEYRDEDTGQHIRRISNYSMTIAEILGWSKEEQERVLYASPMHDVGKIGIPDAILQKKGKLTPDEMKTMQNHPLIGARILHDPDSEILTLSEEIALSHHEKFNGKGYPKGLKAKEIPANGRIVAVADVFDALVSKRTYKPPFDVEKALDIIKEDAGTHFDPDVVDALFKGLDDILMIKEQYKDEAVQDVPGEDAKERP